MQHNGTWLFLQADRSLELACMGASDNIVEAFNKKGKGSLRKGQMRLEAFRQQGSHGPQ